MAMARAHVAATGLWEALVRKAGGDPDVFPPAVAPIDPDLLSLPERMRAAAFGDGLARLPIEEGISALGLLYSRSLPVEHRRKHGIFYTPPALAVRLVGKADAAGMDWTSGKVISPACGGGQILLESAGRMVAALDGRKCADVVVTVGSRLRGWDIDPFGCWLSQLVVEALLLPQVVASGERLGPITRCRDSLSAGLERHHGRYALVVENPAFGKVRASADLALRFGRSQRGHPNLYGLFADLSLRLAEPSGGTVALLTPTSYLSGGYFSKLRGLLRREAALASIDIVSSRRGVFPDVLQEVALSVFVRGRSPGPAPCSAIELRRGRVVEEPAGDIVLPPDPEAPWVAARSTAAVPTVVAMRSMSTKLADWGYRVGTGPLVPHKSDRMRKVPSATTVPVVWAECVSRSGRFEVRCTRPGRAAHYEPGPRDANVVAAACFLLQRTTAKEQRRRLVGAVLSQADIDVAGGKVAVENHLNMLVPLNARPTVSIAALAAFFASGAADRAFRCIGGSVAVSAAELRSMPLPEAHCILAALASADPQAALDRLYGAGDADAKLDSAY